MSTLTGTPLAAPDAGTPVRDAPAERTPKRRKSAGAPRERRSIVLTLVMALLLIYSVLPLFWLLVNSTKTQDALFSSFASGSRATSRCGTTSRAC